MSELTLLVLRLVFLSLLWVFVFSIVFTLKSDLFGRKVRKLPELVQAVSPPLKLLDPVEPSFLRETLPGNPAFQNVINAHSGRDPLPRKLVIVSGSKMGAEFPLGTDDILIGRSSDSTIVILDDYTSSNHAKLSQTSGQWVVTDLGSTNGTLVNDIKIAGPTPLEPGVPVSIGGTRFELRL